MNTIPLRPATILKQTVGPDRSVDLTVLCANGDDCHITVEWAATTTKGLADAVERAVVDLEQAYVDHDGAVASFLADAREALGPDEEL